jgi:three-Cys-motif partner protein
MVRKIYNWTKGEILEDHSRRKHRIVREYFIDYLRVRCQLPQQTKFRLAVVDGFAGGGKYSCGTPGSPIIFIEELRRAEEILNIMRAAQGAVPIEIECLLVLNDFTRDTIELLKTHVAPFQAAIRAGSARLHLQVEYLSETFESAYPAIKQLLKQGRYPSVLFNLDQAGHIHVDRSILIDIMQSFRSPEIFFTFMIEAFIAFLRKSDPGLLQTQLAHIGLTGDNTGEVKNCIISRQDWLGAAERMVFGAFRSCAPYVSPFSINNPDGWRYWLIHFANSYRARQVYNNVLHRNSSVQAHFGRSGLDMLAYDPTHDDYDLYLFDDPGRERSRVQLLDDIPRLISESGDAIGVGDFYAAVYNITPAHSDDVHAALIESPDMEVITPAGGERRKADTIAIGDTIKLKRQRSFFPMFLSPNRRKDVPSDRRSAMSACSRTNKPSEPQDPPETLEW